MNHHSNIARYIFVVFVIAGVSAFAEDDLTLIVGRVVDTNGDPIANAHIRSKRWGEAPNPTSETVSDEDGRFRVKGWRGECRLFVHADGYASLFRTHNVAKGINRGWDFSLTKSAYVSGTVTDTQGNPQPGRSLVLTPVGDSPPPAPGVSVYVSGGRVLTDSAGRFEMSNMAPGRHQIRLLHRARAGSGSTFHQLPLIGRFVDVDPGARIDAFKIVVNPPEEFAIGGCVTDEGGNPIRGVVVDAFIPHGNHWSARTDEKGMYTLNGLDGMGQSSVRVHFNGVGGAPDFQLALPDVPLNTKDANLIIPGRGNVKGTVRDAGTGNAVSVFEVTVPKIELHDSGAVWVKPEVRIEADGHGAFTISDVPAGEAFIEVRANGLGSQQFRIAVETGETSVLEADMLGPALLVGKTTMDGEPRSTGIVVNDEWLQSDDSGNFRFDHLPNGKHLLWFFVHDGWHRTVEVDLKSGETTLIDVDTGGSCEVRGTIHFPEDLGFCTVRLSPLHAPDGWLETGRPRVHEFVLAYSHVHESGGEYRLRGIPPGRWYLMAGQYDASIHRSPLAASEVLELKDGQVVEHDFDLRVPVVAVAE